MHFWLVDVVQKTVRWHTPTSLTLMVNNAEELIRFDQSVYGCKYVVCKIVEKHLHNHSDRKFNDK